MKACESFLATCELRAPWESCGASEVPALGVLELSFRHNCTPLVQRCKATLAARKWYNLSNAPSSFASPEVQATLLGCMPAAEALALVPEHAAELAKMCERRGKMLGHWKEELHEALRNSGDRSLAHKALARVAREVRRRRRQLDTRAGAGGGARGCPSLAEAPKQAASQAATALATHPMCCRNVLFPQQRNCLLALCHPHLCF